LENNSLILEIPDSFKESVSGLRLQLRSYFSRLMGNFNAPIQRDFRTFTLFDANILEEMNSGSDTFYGRIVCINPHNNPLEKAPPTLEYLCDADQLFPFIIGPDTVEMLHGMNHRDLLLNIGYKEDWLNLKHSRGLVFYLVVFRKSACDKELKMAPVLANWDEIFKLITQISRGCAEKLRPHWAEIDKVEYTKDIESIENAELYKVVSSFEEFAKASVVCDSPKMARQFLRHTLKCTALFKGDGFTYNEQGVKGLTEYLFKRVSLKQLNGSNKNGIVLCQKLGW
jgi:hypothetical protein